MLEASHGFRSRAIPDGAWRAAALAGAPRQGVVLRQADLFMIPFSLLWGGFAVFWEFSVLRTGGPGFFALWGLPFVAVGIYVTIGRFFVDLATLSDVSMTERPDGSGTITFGAMNPMYAMYAGMSWPGVPQVPSFEMIPDVRSVYRIVQTAQQDVLAHRSA